MAHRWNDDFLNTLRDQGDALADDYLQRLIADKEIEDLRFLFKELNTNDHRPAPEMHPAFTEFYDLTSRLPETVDLQRIARAEEAFGRHAFPAALVLLVKSLNEGYASPGLAKILNMSGNLERKPYRRLLQVLQMVLNVGAGRGFEHEGKAVITAQKLRLLHAGIRHVAHRHVPDYAKRYGVAINHEDMLATILGFSLLVIDGMEILEFPFSRQEAEDYLYMWNVYALMIGIHPPGEPASMDYLPDNVDDARTLYNEYARRHYTSADKNPDGVQLSRANLKMLKKLVPFWLRLLGFGLAPRIYTQHLIGREACRRVGIRPLPGFPLFKWLLFNMPKAYMAVYTLFNPETRHFPSSHHFLSEGVFRRMINKKFGHEITFTVPVTLKDVREMVNR